MSVSKATNAVVTYTGNDTASEFAVPFPTYSEDDLVVEIETVATGAVQAIVLDTDYSLDDIGIPGTNAELTLIDASQAWVDGDGDLATGYRLIIRFTDDGYQTTNLQNLGRFASATFGATLDRATMFIKALQAKLSRGLLISQKSLDAGFDPLLPTPLAGDEDRVLMLNATKDGFEFGPTATEVSGAGASAIAAAASATAAGLSETAAGLSETAAGLSETAAGLSETAAAASAAAAAASAAAAAASAGFTIVANQSIAAGGQITPDVNVRQVLKVQGNGAARTTDTAPFISSPADGTLIVLAGQHAVNTLTIPYADVAGGFVGNGDCTLGLNDTLTLLFDLTANRHYEVSRSR
jgi:hypothetical protein